MNVKMRNGKSSELIVAAELMRHSLDVYTPAVDDIAIDLIIRVERNTEVKYYDVQVKSVKADNRIIGVKAPRSAQQNYFLIICYRHDVPPDEIIYLTRSQVSKHLLSDSEWGDLVINKPEREMYADQNLKHLASSLTPEETS